MSPGELSLDDRASLLVWLRVVSLGALRLFVVTFVVTDGAAVVEVLTVLAMGQDGVVRIDVEAPTLNETHTHR